MRDSGFIYYTYSIGLFYLVYYFLNTQSFHCLSSPYVYLYIRTLRTYCERTSLFGYTNAAVYCRFSMLLNHVMSIKMQLLLV